MKRTLCKLVRFYTLYFPLRKGKVPLLLLLNKLGLFRHITEIGKIKNRSLVYLNLEDWVQQLVYFFGVYEYEKPESEEWISIAAKSKLILDIGANFGYYSILAADINPTSRIYSFEPAPETFARLKVNIELNKFSNIQLVNKGVSDTEGNFTLYLSKTDNSGMTSLRIPENYSGESVSVDVVSCDRFIKNQSLSGVDLVKIDVEGNEFNVLKGMEDIIKNDQPVIFIELMENHLKRFGHNLNVVFDFFNERNYRMYEFRKNEGFMLLQDPKDVGLAICCPESKLDKLSFHSN